jgi:hypothetical protein
MCKLRLASPLARTLKLAIDTVGNLRPLPQFEKR